MKGFVAAGIAALLLAMHLPCPRDAAAQGAFNLLNERNHPQLRWLELRTPHFRIFYHEPLEPWAREAASILERYHGPACRRLDTYPEKPTRVYISDQDQIANGMAIGYDYMIAWIPSHAATASFAGSRTWFEEVLVHEYGHVLTAWASRTWLGNVAYLTGNYPPRWLHEGVSQWLAESWNVLRGDLTLSGSILDEGMHRWPRDGRLLYATGNARVRWIAHEHGDSAVQRLLRPAGPLGTYTYDAAHRRAFGKKGKELLDRFRRTMIGFYGARYEAGEDPDSIGRRMDPGLHWATLVAQGPDGLHWWTGSRSSSRPENSLFRIRGGGTPHRVLAGSVTERAVPFPGGGVLVPRWHRAAHGAIVQDLAAWSPDGGAAFLTKGERAVEAASVAGGRIVVIEDDSRLGPALLMAKMAAPRGPVNYDTFRRWPRGTLLHSLASSPSGERFAVSVVDPDGRRGMAGFDANAGNTPIAIADLEECRDTAFLDEQTLVVTSFASGTAQLRAIPWPAATDTSAAPQSGARDLTRLGAGIGLVGIIGDSLIGLDRSSRSTSRLFGIDPAREAEPARVGRPYPFPSAPAIDPESRTLHIEGPFPYRAWSEVRPWLHLPLIGPQAGRIGFGGATLWAEPLLRHCFGGFVYTSDRSLGNPDRALFYGTTRFGPWATAYHASILWPRRIWDDAILTERREATGVFIEQPLHDAGDPNVEGWLSLGMEAITAWPRFGAADDATRAGVPRSWSRHAARLGLGRVRIPAHGSGTATIREGSGFTATLEAGVTRGEHERYARGRLLGFLCRPAPVPGGAILWLESNVRMTSGRVPAQEFEGLDDVPSHAVARGWNLLDGAVFLRGWPGVVPARGVAHANAELRFPVLPDLGIRGLGLSLGSGTLAPFLEVARVWGIHDPLPFEERTRGGFGIEGRWSAGVGRLRFVPSLAVGGPIGRGSLDAHWSFRISAARPAGPVLDPPSWIRGLLGGAAQDLGPPCGLPTPTPVP